MIRMVIRRWLGIIEAPHDVERLVKSSVSKEVKRAVDEQVKGINLTKTAYERVQVDYTNVINEITDLQDKFDALAEAMGVVIIVTPGEGAQIISVREDGLLGDAKRYIVAAQAADNFLNIQLQVLKEQEKLFYKLRRSQS